MKAGIWRHHRGGYYQVLGLARHSETGEDLVIAVSLDTTKSGPRLRAQPLDKWEEKVSADRAPGEISPRLVARFSYVGDELP